MRPSLRLLSAMPGGKQYIGWWGDMGGPKQKYIVQYGLSPFQQSAMRDALRGYVFNGYSRIVAQLPYFLLPFATGYGIYVWANKTSEYLEGKEGHYAGMETAHKAG